MKKKSLFLEKQVPPLKFCILIEDFNGRSGQFGWSHLLLPLKNAYLMQISTVGSWRTVPLYILTYKTSSFLTLIYGVLHGALPPPVSPGKKVGFRSLFQLLGTCQNWPGFWDFRRFSEAPRSKKRGLFLTFWGRFSIL